MTKKAILYVTNAPVEGRDDEWNAWYSEVHLPEIFEHVPGIKSATRFRRAEGTPGGPEQNEYCTLYEVEAEDPAQAVTDLVAAAQGGKLHMSEAGAKGSKMFLWEECLPRTTRS